MTAKRLAKLMKAALFALILGCSASICAHAEAPSMSSLSQEKIGQLETMHQKATESLLKNDFSDAIRVYSDILLIEPDDEVAYTNLGQIYMILGQQKKAHEAFKNALDINPHNETAIVGIQKILDPDGVEGMISRDEIRTEPLLPEKIKTELVHVPEEIQKSGVPLEILNPQWVKNFAPGKRSSPQRARSVVVPLSVAPKKVQMISRRDGASQANVPVIFSQKKSKAPKLSTLMLRPGRLRIQRFQMALKNGGFYNGRVNGLLGITTRRALIKFQKQHGLEPNGKTSASTWTRLQPYLLKN